jgi:hypothetical protein
VLDFDAHGDDGLAAAFFDRAEVAGLRADGIEIAALQLAEGRHGLPNAGSGPNDDGVIGLAEADEQRGGRGVVLDHGV